MSFSRYDADKTMNFVDHGHVHTYDMPDGTSVCVAEFEPHWSWENDMKPIVKTDSCQMKHMGYCLQGCMVVQPDNGEQFTVKKGEVFNIEPGHHAYTNEYTTMVDFHVNGALNFGDK